MNISKKQWQVLVIGLVLVLASFLYRRYWPWIEATQAIKYENEGVS